MKKNIINIQDEESDVLLCLANVALITELKNNNFLESDFFKKMNYEDEFFKEIMAEIGNPMMLQTYLYMLLVIPKEILTNSEQGILKIIVDDFFRTECIDCKTYSKYKGEDDNKNIDFYRHIRNAVAHSKCYYKNNIVTFYDENINTKNEICEINIECFKIGLLCEKLYVELKIIMEKRFKNK